MIRNGCWSLSRAEHRRRRKWFDELFGDDEDMNDVDLGILPASVRVWTVSESVGDAIATDYRNHDGVLELTRPNP